MSKNVPCPCKQDCPNRKVGCRSSCCKYKIYETLKAKEYKERKAEREAVNLEFAYRESVQKRMARTNRRKPRYT